MGDKSTYINKDADLSWPGVTGYKQFKVSLADTFFKLFPNLSKNALDYHVKVYINKFVVPEKKETFEEERIRFRNYLIHTYKLDEPMI